MKDLKEISEKFSPEMALLVLICRVYFNKANEHELEAWLKEQKTDWKFLGQIIKVHQVRPMVYKVLSAGYHGVDPVFLEMLRKNCLQVATGNLQKLDELVRLSKLFKTRGIKIVPYKGVILSRILFGDYISRETADIDFLTDPVYFPQLREILLSEGYVYSYYNPDFEKQILGTSFELLFTKRTESGLLKIEVHWQLTSKMLDIPLQLKDLMKNPDTVNIRGQELETLNLENLALSLMVHHGCNDIWRVMRHCLDIGLFMEKYRDEIDWARFYELTKKYHIRKTSATGFYLAQELFGSAVPKPFRDETKNADSLIASLLRFPPVNRVKFTLQNLRQHLQLRDSYLDKIRLLFHYLVAGITPNIRDMEAVKVPQPWYFLYYFIKPFRLIFKRR